jgi:hypothetical protein
MITFDSNPQALDISSQELLSALKNGFVLYDASSLPSAGVNVNTTIRPAGTGKWVVACHGLEHDGEDTHGQPWSSAKCYGYLTESGLSSLTAHENCTCLRTLQMTLSEQPHK